MCEISVVNLRDTSLNKKLYLIMGSLGSVEHSDGWGFSTSGGKAWKCDLPMFWTSDSGYVLRKQIEEEDGKPLLGHIRRASPKVPVTAENAHPFKQNDVVFVHNGKLTPKDDKKFDIEYELPKMKDGKPELDSTGKPKMEKFNKSDSLVFFEEFMTNFTDEEHFMDALQKTMDEFYGKFAFVFVINGNFYIVRGKSADLHITYLRSGSEEEAETIGWAINTSKPVIKISTSLLSNMRQLEGEPYLDFSPVELLDAETVYKATETGLEILGKIKENYAPVKQYESRSYASSSSSSKNKKPTVMENYTQQVVEFMLAYSLSPGDIQLIMLATSGLSTLEVNEAALKNLVEDVIPLLKNLTKKDIRKGLKKALSNMALRHYRYEGLQYPWMLNSHEEQLSLISRLEEK